MESVVKFVKTTATIIFSNGTSYEIPLVNKNYMTTDLKNYCTSIRINEKLYSPSGSNIVGNICGNTMSLEITSYDKLLISSNEESVYYGFMNDSAVIEIRCSTDENNDIYMGRYFVDTWENGADSSSSGSVSISCVDLLSKIKSIALGKIRLRRNLSLKDYLVMIIDLLNETLPDTMKILYDPAELDIFVSSNYPWQLYFNNVDRDNIETIFNNIAKDTVSYLWIDRSRYLRLDNLLDDKGSEAVSTLSGSLNLFAYGLQSGDIDKYSGVKVTYTTDINLEDKQVLKLSGYKLYKGNNNISNATLNVDKVFNINSIEIECENGQAICISFEHYKRSIDLIIKSDKETKADIYVYGTVLNEITDSITKYKDDNNKNSLVEIENKILRKEFINTYVDGLIQLMSMKNNIIYAEGYINPAVKLGDLIYVNGRKLAIDAYYKVIGLDFTLGINYRCKATLLRTVSITPSADSILYNNNLLLNKSLSGEIVDTNNLVILSDEDESIVYSQIGTELENLNRVLKGV